MSNRGDLFKSKCSDIDEFSIQSRKSFLEGLEESQFQQEMSTLKYSSY